MSNETPLAKLPDSQVFSRDPELIEGEVLEDVVRRMTAVSERLRRQRGNLAEADRAAVEAKVVKKPRKKRKTKGSDDVA